MKFNINNYIQVQLTKFGRQVLAREAPEKLIFSNLLPSKEYKFQL